MENVQEEQERVKKIVVDQFEHNEAGVRMQLHHLALYLLNEEDFGISPAEFRPERHEHAIPKYEMARIYLIVCATTGDQLGFSPDDSDDETYRIYERAYQRCLRYESDPSLLRKIHTIGAECGFRDEATDADEDTAH